MKVTILGSGTVVPDPNRNSSGYFVETSTTRVLLDCGAGTTHSMARYQLPWQSLSHIFISHFHVDHCGELAGLFQALKYGLKSPRTEPLTLVGPNGLERVVKRLKKIYSPTLFETGFPTSMTLMDPGDHIEVGEVFRLSVFKTPHTEESLAVRIDSEHRSLCYTGDTEYSDELAEFFRDTDLLISECSLLEPRQGLRHMSVDEVAMLAAKSRAGNLVVTHFYFKVNPAKLKERLKRNFDGDVTIGEDGMIIEL